MKTINLPEGLVLETINSLGIEVLSETGAELIALCPGHKDRTGKEDHKPSWSINAQSGVHHCFSCGFKGNLYTLVRDKSGLSEANRFWADKTPPDMPVPEGYTVDRTLTLTTMPTQAQPRVMSESRMALYVSPPKWALDKRKIAPWAADIHSIRWTDHLDAWVLPLRDPDTDALMGYQLKGQRERLMLNRPTGMKKGNTLFGYQAARGHDRIVVVESPLDAAMLLGLGHPAVAICGSRVTSRQESILCRFPHFTLALDNDDAGRAETERLRRSLHSSVQYGWVTYRDNDPKDVGEMGNADIEALLSGARV